MICEHVPLCTQREGDMAKFVRIYFDNPVFQPLLNDFYMLLQFFRCAAVVAIVTVSQNAEDRSRFVNSTILSANRIENDNLYIRLTAAENKMISDY